MCTSDKLGGWSGAKLLILQVYCLQQAGQQCFEGGSSHSRQVNASGFRLLVSHSACRLLDFNRHNSKAQIVKERQSVFPDEPAGSLLFLSYSWHYLYACGVVDVPKRLSLDWGAWQQLLIVDCCGPSCHDGTRCCSSSERRGRVHGRCIRCSEWHSTPWWY
jgi:hypothetical protein